jgi:hypothetical protein
MRAIGTRSLSSVLTMLVDGAWYGALVLFGLSFCLLLVAPWVDPPRVEVGLAVPAAIRIDSDALRVVAAPKDVAHVHLDAASASLKFSPRSHAFVAAAAIFLMTVLALVLWVLRELGAVLRTLRAGQPFIAANAARIRHIAYAVMAGELARAVLNFAGTYYAMTHFSLDGVRLESRLDIGLGPIVSGLVILVIAEVFHEGTRLDQEQSLTI